MNPNSQLSVYYVTLCDEQVSIDHYPTCQDLKNSNNAEGFHTLCLHNVKYKSIR